MQAQALFFEAKQQVTLSPIDLPQVGPKQILARAICSLVSSGTEGICFNRLFTEGGPFAQWVKYPFQPGYSWIGQVLEVGSEVTDVKVGDRVAARLQHASHHVFNADEAILIPDAVPSELAAWFGLAKITGVGAHAAAYKLGDHVAIIGAGPIGQMSARWAVANGCQSVIVIDPVAKRLDVALKGGATHVIDKPVQEVKPMLQAILGGKLPDIVMDSTGHAVVFEHALSLPRQFGKMVLMGTPGVPSEQHLTEDLTRNGIHLIGAHDIHNSPDWNNHTYAKFYFSMYKRGLFNMDDMNWHTFKPHECTHVYPYMTENRSETMGILFDWTQM